MKIYDSRITVTVLACICFIQFTFVLLVSGEENIGNYVLTPSVSTTNSTSSETIMDNENDRESTYASMRGNLSNQNSAKESLENTIEEPPFHKKYSNKNLTELVNQVGLIVQKINLIYHEKHSINISPFVARLNKFSPYINLKEEVVRNVYNILLINKNQQIEKSALQKIFTKFYIDTNFKNFEEFWERMYKEVSEKYHGYYGIGYSSVHDKQIKLQFFRFSKEYVIEAYLNSGSPFGTCKRRSLKDYEHCYNINYISRHKHLRRYVDLDKDSMQNYCIGVTPVTYSFKNGGSSKCDDSDSTDDDSDDNDNDDNMCTCEESYMGDTIEYSDKYIEGPISHSERCRNNSYERLENLVEVN